MLLWSKLERKRCSKVIGCLIIESSNLSKSLLIDMLDKVFVGVEYTFESEKDVVIVLIGTDDQRKLWQMVLNLEVEKIVVGYGIALSQHDAINIAKQRMQQIKAYSKS